MKTFLALVLAAVLVWGGWNWISNHKTEVSIETTESPEAIMPGLGGEGPEPVNYEDAGDTDIGGLSETSAPVVSPTPVIRVASPRAATPRPTPTPTATPAPVLAFRNIDSMNGSSETGVMVITSADNGNAVINFNMNSYPGGVSQPTYIYRGTSCQGSEQIVWALNPMFNGSTMTSLPVKASDLISGQGGPYYLVIHQSAENDTRVSCALIR